jgi:DNA-binding NarL/FixJ family response regulator
MPEQSARYRDLLAPLGIGDELRVAFVVDGQCWGACALYRDQGRPDFTDADAEFVARLSGTLAEGIQRVLILGEPRAELVTHGPGVVILDADNQVVSISPTARELVSRIADIGPGDPDRLPAVIHAVAARAQAIEESGSATAARAHVPTTDGGCLAVHGTILDGAGESRIAVVIDTARPADLAPIIVSAYRLTEREREVAALVLRGLATRDIAGELHLSPHTVQDHLKAVFAKTGVHSRRELSARVFHDHYEPHLRAGHLPGPSGYFG